jgi:Na+-translocating ferredoxin:NAD+ oxidoreductase subunit G
LVLLKKQKKKMERESKENRKSAASKILGSKIYPVVFLVIIVLISVSLVMVIGNMTQAKIAGQRDAEILKQLNIIFPEMTDFKYLDKYYEIYAGSDIAGFAFTVKGKGYGGDINILAGIDENYNIKSITILSNTETPGLGTRIEEDAFTGQFKGLILQDIGLSKDGGKIDAITGATVSSKAVTDALRGQMEEIIGIIKKGN